MSGWADERRAGLLAEPGDDIDDARRNAGLQRQLGQPQHRQAGLLGRLQHRGVAGSQRHPDGAPEHLRRVVPRDDVADDPARLAQDHHLIAVEEGDGVAVDLVGGAAVELEIAGAGGDVVPRLLHRLAGVHGLDLGKFVEMIEDQAAQPGQHPPPVDRRRAAPHALEGMARRLDRPVDVFAAAARDPRDLLAIRGTEDRNGVAARRTDPLAVDQYLLETHDVHAVARDQAR